MCKIVNFKFQIFSKTVIHKKCPMFKISFSKSEAKIFWEFSRLKIEEKTHQV